MEWRDDGIVLSSRRHGERDSILEVMTARHGRHLGLVRGGRSSRQAPALQPGNRLALTWRARLEEHLGNFSAELVESRAALVLADALALNVVTHLGVLVRLMPERQAHANVYEAADALLGVLDRRAVLAPALVRFELLILAELGFGLDLSRCAATGRLDDLVYVSPKSGRAVSRDAGTPWASKMLALPDFLLRPLAASEVVPPGMLAAGFALTGHFLECHLFDPRRASPGAARARIVAALCEEQFSG